MKESAKAKKLRIKNALAALQAAYPDARPQLDFTNPFELLVATMLSAQCTDKRVNMVTEKLFPALGTPQKLADATEEEVISYIRGCGLFNTKARNLIAAARIIRAVQRRGAEGPGCAHGAARGRAQDRERRGVKCLRCAGNSRGYPCFQGVEPHRPCGSKGCGRDGKAAHGEHTQRGLVNGPSLDNIPRQAGMLGEKAKLWGLHSKGVL